MELDYDRADEKKNKIISSLSSILQKNVGVKNSFEQISREIFLKCITVRPPEKEKVECQSYHNSNDTNNVIDGITSNIIVLNSV